MKRIVFSSEPQFEMYAFVRSEELAELDWLKALYASELKPFAMKRKNDFLSGRYVAHYALERLNADFQAEKILRSVAGNPIFPNSTIGSIAHSDHYACAYVSTANHGESVGVDVETILSQETYSKIKDIVFTKCEIQLIENSVEALLVSTIIFSAKESLYKCISPRYNRFIHFLEVEMIHLDLDQKSYNLRLGTEIWKGHFERIDHSIFTLIKSPLT